MRKILLCVSALLAPLARADMPPPAVHARAFALVDAASGALLAGRAAASRADPGALTRLMVEYAACAAVRDGRLSRAAAAPVPAAAAAAQGPRMYLRAGQTATVGELLRGLAVTGGNDAALALAQAAAGGEAPFVARMNAAAARLGLRGTRFANATGQPQAGQWSTAADLAALSVALARDFPQCLADHAAREVVVNGVAQPNANRLLWQDPYSDGLAAGQAGRGDLQIAATERRGARRLVAVLLGEPTDAQRLADARNLLSYGFGGFETRRLYARADSVVLARVWKGQSSGVRVGPAQDAWLTVPRGVFGRLQAAAVMPQLVAPVRAGQPAGVLRLTLDGRPYADYPLVAQQDVPRAGLFGRLWDSLWLLFH